MVELFIDTENTETPTCVNFTWMGSEYSIKAYGKHVYKSLSEIPEDAIINLLKHELRWWDKYSRALLGGLEFCSAPQVVLVDSGLRCEIATWNFHTLHDARLIFSLIESISLSLFNDMLQLKQYVIDQTGLSL